MLTQILKILTDKELLKTSGLIVIVLLLILAIAGGGYTYWLTVSNHLDHNTSALLQQAVTNEKVSASLDKLTTLLDKKLK